MYKCSFCSFMFSSIRKYNLHQYYHRKSKGCFKCVTCSQQLSTYNAFTSHNLRHSHSHISDNEKPLLKQQIYKCSSVDCVFKTSIKKQIKSHSYRHIKSKEFLKCPFHMECKSKTIFNSVVKLTNHFTRKHGTLDCTGYNISRNNNFQLDEIQSSSVNILIESDNDCVVNEDMEDTASEEVEESYLQLLSNMYLNLESKHFLSKNTLQTLINGFLDINELNTTYLFKQISEAGITIDQNVLKNNLFYAAHNEESGIFRTPHLREKYYSENLNYIAPIKQSIQAGSSFFIMYLYWKHLNYC